MEENWRLERVEIKGGFLQDVSLGLPPGLTCIIGPRGSGKSTLAEALRSGMSGIDNVSKARSDLYRANLGKSVITIRTLPSSEGVSYVIRREGRQPAILTTADGRALPSVDLERGTFLPFEAYSSTEIEEIAEERLGPKRRMLLDDLRLEEVHRVQAQLSTARREMEANADEIRAIRRTIEGLNEQVQILVDAPDRLLALGPAPVPSKDTTALQEAARQDNMNRLEIKRVQALRSHISTLINHASTIVTAFENALNQPVTDPASRNNAESVQIDNEIAHLLDVVQSNASTIQLAATQAAEQIAQISQRLEQAHLEQGAAYAELREQNKAAGEAVRERTEAEESVRKLHDLQNQRADADRAEVSLDGSTQVAARQIHSAVSNVVRTPRIYRQGVGPRSGYERSHPRSP